MDKIPILLLAAGSSSRMLQPKQLLPWGNQTLIEFQLKKLLETNCPVLVVLGANSEKIVPLIQLFPIQIVINNQWQKGMGTSISCGMNFLAENFQDSSAVLISLIDQPLVPLGHFNKMVELFRQGNKKIIASCSSSGWAGVPAIFDKIYFERLKNLDGEKGARELIRENLDSVVQVECDEIMYDVDTPESYETVLRIFEGRKGPLRDFI